MSYPLVTLAILTYNQVDFIRSAIGGAFSQDYFNLEIIISDDGSTDGTLDEIEKIVSQYQGSHAVRINQTPTNKCTLGHFFDVVDLANGEILILSAGDDISKSERVTEIVKIWKEQSPAAVFSNYELVDEDGVVCGGVYNPSGRSELLTNVFKQCRGFDVHGASSAYDMAFLKRLPKPEGRFFFEDTYMTFMASLFGEKVIKIEKPLVFYRTHTNSISNSQDSSKSFAHVRNAQIKASYYAKNKYELYLFLRDFASSLKARGEGSRFEMIDLDAHVDILKIKGSWVDYTIIQRISCLLKFRSNKSFIKWMAPRVFGVSFFSLFRMLRF